jgi:Skp family chaperone for outer membrane proteins
MRILIGAVAMALIFAAPPASAQAQPAPSNCSDFAPVPTLPDGATADRDAIEAGNTQYESWGHARLAKLQLCRADIEALRAQLVPLEQSYNSNTEELNTVVANWQVEVAEFNARPGSARNRRDPRAAPARINPE